MSESGPESFGKGKNFCVGGIEEHRRDAIKGLAEKSIALLLLRQIGKVTIEGLDAKGVIS